MGEPFDVKRIIRKNILSLEPYRCARDDFKTGVLLDANENTHGPALETLTQEEDLLELNRYPDPHQAELKQKICNFRNSKPNKFLHEFEKFKLSTDNLCLGVGSDESIDALLRCVCVPGKDKLLVCPPTYGMYSICAKVNDVGLVQVPLTYPHFQLDTEEIVKTVTSDTSIKLIYVTSPGNPTAKLIDVKSIVSLLQTLESKWQGLFIVDEAYIDFTVCKDNDPNSQYSESMSTLVNQFPNLVVFQTLSKAFGLAGIRLGVTYCSKVLSHYLNSMKFPYNISSLTSNVALRATDPQSGLQKMHTYVTEIIRQRELLSSKLQQLSGIGKNIGGNDSNFILLQILDQNGSPSNEAALKLYNALAVENNVVVRFRGRELNCEGALRISVGTKEENSILLDRIESCLRTL